MILGRTLPLALEVELPEKPLEVPYAMLEVEALSLSVVDAESRDERDDTCLGLLVLS